MRVLWQDCMDARCDEISNQQAVSEEGIHNTITHVRKTELISQLHQLTQAKLKSLAAQRDQIETTQAQLNRHHHSMRETTNQGEVLLMKITAVRQVNELTTSILPGLLEPRGRHGALCWLSRQYHRLSELWVGSSRFPAF